MLDHLFTLFGPSKLPPLPFNTKERALILYATSDSITVLNASTLGVARVLSFWEAFPSTYNGDAIISSIAADEDNQRVVASLGSLVTIWSCVSNDGTSWRIHSTFAIAADVLCLDCKSNSVVLGTSRAISEFQLTEDGDLPTWEKRWSIRHVEPRIVAYSPGKTHIACTSGVETAVTIISTRTHRETLRIRHPKTPTSLHWRPSKEMAGREDIVLYTITPDFTIRTFMTVLDAPSILQLHATIDRYSFLPDTTFNVDGSHIFPLNRLIVRNAIEAFLEDDANTSEVALRRRPLLQQILDERWDLFARILPDGSLVLRALANIDRRPPTLLRQFTILHTPPKSFPRPNPSSPACLSIHCSPSTPRTLTLLTSPPLRSYEVSLLNFFDGQITGLKRLTRSWDPPVEPSLLAPNRKIGCCRRITTLTRTPEGDAISVAREGGDREIWQRGRRGRLKLLAEIPTPPDDTDHVVCLFDEGHTLALYSSKSQTLSIKHFPRGSPPSPQSNHIIQSVALKTSTAPVLFSLPKVADCTPIACATLTETTLIHVTIGTQAQTGQTEITLRLQKTQPLPVSVPPEIIMPVDPMAWNPPTDPNLVPNIRKNDDSERDAFASISPEGELSFWATANPNHADIPGWRCTGLVHTSRKKIVRALCSSAKKTALAVHVPEGQEVTIWDSKESEFSSGLEYVNIFDEEIMDLDWTSTYDSLSILSIGFAHKVLVLCPQRMSYFDEKPTWGILHTVDMSKFAPSPIGDSIWMSEGSLLTAVGHQMFFFGEPREPFIPAAEDNGIEGSLFENVARHNGPLDEFHPQLILQCLLWNKVDLVKGIITALAHNVATVRNNKNQDIKLLPLESFWEGDETLPSKTSNRTIEYSTLLGSPQPYVDGDEEHVFGRDMVRHLVESLEEYPLPHLTPSEMEHLIILIQTTLEIDEQRRSLDASGVRYLISIRSFFIINRRFVEETGSTTPKSIKSRRGILAPFVRERIRYRDIVWAFHSESQEILMDASTTACGGKMLWLDARALGVFLWARSQESLKNQMEVIARNQYMAGDARDPTACCLFYFALGKVKLVHGLWKQAAWHKEQSIMLKFLSNDFSDPRWQTAALKNAFALLSKQRYEYAASFFLLGGSVKDAANVCLKQLQDFQLAVALARVTEGDDGPVLQDIITNHVLPRAFRDGNRWLGSWAFWMLKRRDMAVRILLTPLRELAKDFETRPKEIGDPHFDDPSLAILFAQLKSKSLQTVKGTSEIPGQTEFNFVHQIARVLCRMGCHVLAIDLMRSWSFDRPVVAVAPPPKDILQPVDDMLSILTFANGSQALSPARETSTSGSRPPRSPTVHKPLSRGARASMLIDMELPSFPPTRAPSPPQTNGFASNGSKVDPDAPRGRERKPTEIANPPAPSGFGNLMKSAKKDVVVPEFDMSSFF